MPTDDGLGGSADRLPGDGDYRLVDATAEHAVFELDTEGIIASWSRPAAMMYGHDAADVLGRHLRALFGDPDDLDRPLEALLAQAADGPVPVEAAHERADGGTFWATVTISPIRPEADLRGFAVVSEDTTVARRYERTLERQNDRLKEFTDILVHDLRNPLHVIDRRLGLYRETGDDAHLESLDETVDRMERLVDDLLRVARHGDVVTDREPTDLERVIDLAWEGMGTGVAASLEYEPVQPLRADADRLTELLENLFRNAVEHGGEDVTVRVGPLDGGFHVADDGPGIPTEEREDVFDHGFSADEGGTGYGLSVVRTIANAHGWDVAATESADGGARFEFTGIDP